jgi:hypothetical protein
MPAGSRATWCRVGQSVSKRKIMITIKLGRPVPVKWGEFEVRKTYLVKNEDGTGANGYIIQKVAKTTRAETRDGKTYTSTTDISDLTRGNVLNASDTYYEIFPIINGTTCRNFPPAADRSNCIDDQFQNGGITRYTFESDEEGAPKTWGVDDDPATSGSVDMVGTNVFVPLSKEEAESLYDKIEANKGGSVVYNGITWNLSKRTPANGLPFTASFPLFSSLMKGKRVVIHRVNVSWDFTGRTNVTSGVEEKTGGRRRRTIRARAASRSYRKRRTGKATRRSQGRA